MAIIARRLLSPKLTLVLSMALLAGLLFSAAQTEAGEPAPCPTPTASPSPTQDFAAGCIGEEGGSVKTQSPATEPENPHWTKVTVPPGFPGFVTIDEFDEREFGGEEVSAEGGPVQCVPSSPYTCLVSDITTTQTTTRRKPMIFQFVLDKNVVNKNIQRLRVEHDGRIVPRCDDEDSVRIGYELEQGQESCHAKTVRLRNRDVRLVVLSIINGRWRFR